MNDENECPLGKLNPFTLANNGSKGLWRLKISLTKNKSATLLRPIAAMLKERKVFLLKKESTTPIHNTPEIKTSEIQKK